MITATLCTTNSAEPWAANVEFEVHDDIFTTNLNINYAHYKNLVSNKSVVIVYKTLDYELIMKGDAELFDVNEDEVATVNVSIHWLRLVEKDEIRDFEDSNDIISALVSKQFN